MSPARPSQLTLVLILLCICGSNINNYFGYHAPSATSDKYETIYKLSSSQFGTLFTIYSAPNIVLVFFSGIFIDKYGIVTSSLVFNGIILVGLVLCAQAPVPTENNSYDNTLAYGTLLVGRLFLGLGGESIVACASTMIAKWFTPLDQVNAALSVNQAIVQLMGSSAAFYILPRLPSIQAAQWFTAAIGLFSLLCSVIYIILENKYAPSLHVDKELEYAHLIVYNSIPSCNDDVIPHNLSEAGTRSFSQSQSSSPYQVSATQIEFHADVEDISRYQHGVTETDRVDSLDSVDLDNSSRSNSKMTTSRIVEAESEFGTFFDILPILSKFPLIYWLLWLHNSCLSPILYTFTAFGPLYLKDNFPGFHTSQAAGDAISLLYLGIVFAPISGWVIDRVGHRVWIQSFASLNIFVMFVLMTVGVGGANPRWCLLYTGILFSITEANAMSMVAYTVPANMLGTAYGLSACGISLALLLEPALVGQMRETSGSFGSSMNLFLALIVLGVLASVGMLLVQRRDKIQF